MTDLLARIATVKSKWIMSDLVEQLTGEPVPANHKVCSMFNEADETPSMHIYDDSYYDYSTGNYGDVVDLIRAVKRCTVERAVQILEEEADELGLVQTVRVVAPKPVFKTPLLGWWTGLPSVLIDGPAGVRKDSLAGVSIEILGLLAFVGRIAHHPDTNALAILHGIPGVYHFSRTCPLDVVGIKYRQPSGNKTSEPGSDFSSYLYKPFEYHSTDRTCVITEGETDAWAWLSVRRADHVYSLPSGAQSWKDRFLEQLAGYDDIYLAMDNDEAGRRARDKISLAVGYGRVHHVQVPGVYNDVREAVAAGWTTLLPV